MLFASTLRAHGVPLCRCSALPTTIQTNVWTFPAGTDSQGSTLSHWPLNQHTRSRMHVTPDPCGDEGTHVPCRCSSVKSRSKVCTWADLTAQLKSSRARCSRSAAELALLLLLLLPRLLEVLEDPLLSVLPSVSLPLMLLSF